jgi:DNA-binding protein
MLPAEMNNKGVEIGTEKVEMEDTTRIMSFIKIQLEGVGDFPSDEE